MSKKWEILAESIHEVLVEHEACFDDATFCSFRADIAIVLTHFEEANKKESTTTL